MTRATKYTGDAVEFYARDDERPHDPEPADPHWQESIFLFWWDEANGIGAIHRIGHEPNTSPATANSWNGVFTRDGERFRRYERPELSDVDRLEGGLAAGPSRYWYDDAWRFQLSDSDCELDLTWSGEYLGLAHLYPKRDMTEVHDDYAPQHYETSGRMRGTARIGERTFRVDALAYRDHSWGRREWPTLLAHRYFAGTVGPELTLCTLGWLGIDGTLTSFGVIVRDGAIEYAESVDFLVHMEADGTTHRAGEIDFRMRDGETIEIRPRLVDAVLHEHGGDDNLALSAVDSICVFEYEGKRGFGNFEITNNPRNGKDPVRQSVRAVSENGLSRRDWSFV